MEIYVQVRLSKKDDELNGSQVDMAYRTLVAGLSNVGK
jgi:hypothetical protein